MKIFSNWDSLSSDQTESSLYYHSIYNTKTWRQKWRQKWSPEKGKWEGRKDYVLVVYLNVVLVWREHSANVLRMPDKKNCIARASWQEHHCMSIIALLNIYWSPQTQHLSIVHGWSLHELKWHLKSSKKSSGCDAFTINGRLFQELQIWYLGLVLSLIWW